MADAPPKVPTTPTFPHWLQQQTGRGDEIAEFAKQVADVDDFPESGGKAIYDGYFETTQPAVQETYQRAWSEYQASPEPAAS